MFLYNNLIFIDSLEKKIISKNIYNKYLIRNSYPKTGTSNDALVVIDNNSSFYALKLKYLKGNTTSSKKRTFFSGSSILLNNFVFKKKQFRFEFYSLNAGNLSLDYLDVFFKGLRSLRSSKKALVLIKPQKGGLACYFNGINSFFPFKQFFQVLNMQSTFKNSLFSLQNLGLKDINLVTKKELKNFVKNLRYFLINGCLERTKFLANLKKKKNSTVLKRELGGVTLPLIKNLFRSFLSGKISVALFFGFVRVFMKQLFIFYERRFLSKRFAKLNFLLAKNGRLVPKMMQTFVFYKLRFKIKSNYYNGIFKKRIKTKKKKKQFFKSYIRIIFLSYLQKKKKDLKKK